MELTLHNVQEEQLQLFISSLYKMKQENKYTDVILVSNDREFPVHRVVLAAQSMFFSDIFDTSNDSKEFKKITLQWIASDILNVLLEFLYSRNVAIHKETSDKIKQILDAAYRLKIDALVSICCDCLMRHVSTNEFNDAILISEKYKCQKMKTYIVEYLAENFDDSLDSRDILDLTPHNLRLILSHPLLAVDEDDKMRAVFKWMKHDEISRSQEFPTLLPALDFNKLSTRFLITMADEELLFTKSVSLMKNIIKAMAARLHVNVVNHLQTCSCLGTTNSLMNSFPTSLTSCSSTVSQDSYSSNEEDIFLLSRRKSSSISSPRTSTKTELGHSLENMSLFVSPEENSLVCSAHLTSPRSQEKLFSTTLRITSEDENRLDDPRALYESELNLEEIVLPLPLVAMVCEIWDLIVGFVNGRLPRELFLPSFLSLTHPTS